MFPKRRPTFEKTQSEKLILPELADIIARSPTGDLTFPVNDYGCALGKREGVPEQNERLVRGSRLARPWRQRKNAATEFQLTALFGWTTLTQALAYIKKAKKSGWQPTPQTSWSERLGTKIVPLRSKNCPIVN
jgi:hypothetical protein